MVTMISGICILAFDVVFASISLPAYFEVQFLETHGVKIYANVTNSYTQRLCSKSGCSDFPRLTYEFTARDERNYTGDDLYQDGIMAPSVGQAVPIIYDPQRPSVSRVNIDNFIRVSNFSSIPRWNLYALGGSIALILLIFLILYADARMGTPAKTPEI